MARPATRPKEPEAVALAALALRSYGNGEAPGSPLERAVHQELAKHNVRPEIARAFSSRFYGVRPTARKRYFGDLGEPDAKVPTLRSLARDPIRVKTLAGITLPTGLRLAGARTLDPSRLGDVVIRPGQEVARPTYTIRYKGLYCADDTNDRTVTSDEIYLVTSAVHIRRADGENIIRTERHPKAAQETMYGDLDTFESRIGPIAAVWFGDSDVMSLTTAVFEHDEGDPDYYKEQVEAAVIVALAIASLIWPGLAGLFALAGLVALLTDFFNWFLGSGDDFVGEQTLVLEKNVLETLSASDLIRHTDNVTIFGIFGASQSFVIRTELFYHFFTEHEADGHYVVGYDVLRDPELPTPPPTPVE